MCNCRNEVSERIKESMNIDNGMIDFELFSSKTYTNFRYTNVKGKEKVIPVFNSHCPFCGKRYDEIEVTP